MPALQLIRFRHDQPHYKSLRRERECGIPFACPSRWQVSVSGCD